MKVIRKHPGWVAAVLCAVIAVLSLLWYTRPRSWGNIFYSGELTQFSAVLHTSEANGHTGFYTLDGEDDLEDPCQQILALLEDATYRVRPWDTLAYSLSHGYGETGGGSATIYQIWDQGQQAEYFILYSSGTVCKGNTIYTAKLDDTDLYKTITAVIQEYGTQND